MRTRIAVALLAAVGAVTACGSDPEGRSIADAGTGGVSSANGGTMATGGAATGGAPSGWCPDTTMWVVVVNGPLIGRVPYTLPGCCLPTGECGGLISAHLASELQQQPSPPYFIGSGCRGVDYPPRACGSGTPSTGGATGGTGTGGMLSDASADTGAGGTAPSDAAARDGDATDGNG